jgi:SAM-dependent methyltransferase
MNETTAHALSAINLVFYRERAADFSASREFPWPGWVRLLTHLEPDAVADVPLRVLDVGCGNGRFVDFLTERLAALDPSRHLDYCGVDASAPLLERAAARTRRQPATDASTSTSFVELDFVKDPAQLPGGAFDLVVLLGVLHGVPSRLRRRALVEAAAQRLAPGGLLALTCWRFAELPRFQRRLVSWEVYNSAAAQPVDPTQLEPGDHLMPWGAGQHIVRYCHATDADELDALVHGLSLERVDTYLEDGRSGDLNRYAIFRSARASGTAEAASAAPREPRR